MKPTHTLTTLYRHHQWANLKLLEQCGQLNPDQLDATISGSYGSIRDTLHHIITAEQAYLYRIQTGQPRPDSDDEATLTITEMIEAAQTTGEGFIEWVGSVQDEDTVQMTWKDGLPYQVPKAIILTQVIYHATEHRAQIMTIMTHLGLESPDLQAWEYFDEIKDT